MKPALILLTVCLCPLPMHAGLLDDLTAGNIGASNATFSFRSTDAAGNPVPTRAVLEWGTDKLSGNKTAQQHNSESKPVETDGPVEGLRCLYLDGLQPRQTIHWKLTVTATDGANEEATGSFTTLEVDPTRKRGPDGTHKPPHTPEYATPAAHVAQGWPEVNALLDKCSGGEVIEVASQGSGEAPPIVLTGGHENWEKNVLIRPPLGQRSAGLAGGIEINSPNITIAGFHITGTASMYPRYGNHRGNARGIGARRSFFWMCTMGRQSTLIANGCPDSGWYEVAALYRGVGGDRAQIKTYADIAPDNFTIAGCWIEGRDRTNSTDHNDTLQTLASDASPIKGLRIVDSVFFRSANCSGQMTHLKNLMIENSWFGPLNVKSKVCGSFYSVLTSCDGAIIRNSDFNGSFRQTVNPEEVTQSRFLNLKLPGNTSRENTVEDKLWPQPPFPDLQAIWPE